MDKYLIAHKKIASRMGWIAFFLFLIMALLFIICMDLEKVHAASFSAESRYNFYCNKELRSGPWVNFRLSGDWISVWAGAGQTFRGVYGQEAYKLTMAGGGLGVHQTLFKCLTLSADVGWVHPWATMGKDRATFHEAAMLYFGKRGFTGLTSYDHDIQGGPLAAVTFSMNKQIGRDWSISVNVGYTCLRLSEDWFAFDGVSGYGHIPEEVRADNAFAGITFRR